MLIIHWLKYIYILFLLSTRANRQTFDPYQHLLCFKPIWGVGRPSLQVTDNFPVLIAGGRRMTMGHNALSYVNHHRQSSSTKINWMSLNDLIYVEGTINKSHIQIHTLTMVLVASFFFFNSSVFSFYKRLNKWSVQKHYFNF